MGSATGFVTSIALASTIAVSSATAQETVKIGFSAPITGSFSANGKQMLAAEKCEAVNNPIVDARAKRVCQSGYSSFKEICIDDETGDIVLGIAPANPTNSK